MSTDPEMGPVSGESPVEGRPGVIFSGVAGAQVGSGNVQVNNYAAASSLGAVAALVRVTEPDEFYQPRPAVQDDAVNQLIAEGNRARIVGLVGMSGAGKTCLARAIAHDSRVTGRFGDEVWWLEARNLSDAECQAAVQREFEPSLPGFGDRLYRARRLIVLDNVTRTGQIDAAHTGLGPGSALLVTAWDHNLRHDVASVEVKKWDPHGARSILAAYAGKNADTADAERVLDLCDGLPIALAVCGAMVKAGHEWSGVARLLDKAALDVIDIPFPGYPVPLRAAMVASTSRLPQRERDLYADLAVFAGRGPVPVEAAARLWGGEELDLDDTIRLILRLRDRSLLVYRGGAPAAFQLHDLQYKYVLALASERLAALHGRLASAYLDDWGAPGGIDPAAVGDYPLIHLAHHLAEAGEHERLHALLAAESAHGGNAWHAAHERSGLTGRYLDSLRLARSLARGDSDRAATPAELARGIALEIRYALILSSLTSVASALPANLIAALVRQREWSFDEALAHARVIASPAGRAGALTALARFTKAGSAGRRELVTEAKRAAGEIDRGMHRAFAIQRLVGLVPERDREPLFDTAWAAADTDAHQPTAEIRAWLLHNVARILPERALRELRHGLKEWKGGYDYPEVMIALLPWFPDLRADVLAIARDRRDTGRLRAKALDALLKVTPPDQPADRDQLVGEALALIETARNDYLRGEYTRILLPHLPKDRVRRYAARAGKDERPAWRRSGLTSALPYLPEREQPAVLAAALDALFQEGGIVREHHLRTLRPFLDEDSWELLTGQAMDHKSPAQGVWLVCDLAEHGLALPERILERAVDTCRSANPPSEALDRLAPYLPPRLLRRALTRCALDQPSDWAPAEARLSPHRKEAGKEENVNEATGDPREPQLLNEGGHACGAIRELARQVPAAGPARRREMLRDATAASLAPHAFDDFPCSAVATLAEVLHFVPVTERLPLPPGPAVRPIPGDIEESTQRLALLAMYLQDEAAVSDALRSVAEMGHSKGWRAGLDSARTLAHLAGYLSSAQLLTAAEVACGLPDTDNQATALAALTRHAATESRPSVLPRALTAMRAITSAFHLVSPLAELLPYLTQAQAGELLDLLVKIAERVNNHNLNSLAECLAKLAPHLPAELFPQAARAIAELPVPHDRATTSRALAAAWDNRNPGTWPGYWRSALGHATTAGRPAVLELISCLPIDDFESLPELAAQAVSDVRRWWPPQ